MSDDQTEAAPPAKKKGGKMKKLLIFGVGGVLLIGGGIGAGFYAAGIGFGGAAAAEHIDPNMPKLVAREGIEPEPPLHLKEGQAPDPAKYQSSYYTIEQSFTSNLRDSDGLAQVALGVSTFYDQRVLDNFKNNEMPIRSAILETLAQQDGFVIETPEGKMLLRKQLKTAINQVLKQRTGFAGIDDVYFTSFIIQ